MKKLVLCCESTETEESYLYKDVGLVPAYILKNYKLEVEMLYYNKNITLSEIYRGVKLFKLKKNENKLLNYDKLGIIKNFYFFRYLLKNSKTIDYLMFFHFDTGKLFLIYTYKLLNRNGKVYSKLDIRKDSVIFYSEKKVNFLRKIQHKILQRIIKKIDLISCETKECFKLLLKKGLCKVNILEKLTYIPNGVDDIYFEENEIKINEFEEKENLIITVGRIGIFEKNNEFLLRALEKVNLNDWKVYIIGNATNDFKKYYDDYIHKNSHLKNKVILKGEISDKNELYNYYNRAKIFILTSRLESFGIVLVEALKFGNYILSTDVGAAKDVIKQKNGDIIRNEDDLIKKLTHMISNQDKLREGYSVSRELSDEIFNWSKIIRNSKLKKFLSVEYYDEKF